jgi:hypothetical protein
MGIDMSKGSSKHTKITIGVVALMLILFVCGWIGAVYMNKKHAEEDATTFGNMELQLKNIASSCTTQVNSDGYISCTVTGQNIQQSFKAYNVACPSMWNFHFGCKLQGNIVN